MLDVRLVDRAGVMTYSSPAAERLLGRSRADVLGRLGRETSSGPLVVALSDGSAPVRAQAARALAQLRDERGVYALVKLLGDPSWWVRARAAEALGALGSTGLAALRWCAETHDDPYARERALEERRVQEGVEAQVLREELERAQAEAPDLKHLIVAGAAADGTHALDTADGTRALHTLLDAAPASLEPAPVAGGPSSA